MNTEASAAEPNVITIRLGPPKNKEQLDAFMAEFHANTFFMRPYSIWKDVVAFEIKPFSGRIHLGAIISAVEPGQGHASRALDWLLRLADKHGVEVDGAIKRLGKDGLTAAQLRTWYKRHGFTVKTGGRLLYTPQAPEAAADASANKKSTKSSEPSL